MQAWMIKQGLLAPHPVRPNPSAGCCKPSDTHHNVDSRVLAQRRQAGVCRRVDPSERLLKAMSAKGTP